MPGHTARWYLCWYFLTGFLLRLVLAHFANPGVYLLHGFAVEGLVEAVARGMLHSVPNCPEWPDASATAPSTSKLKMYDGSDQAADKAKPPTERDRDSKGCSRISTS